MRIEQLQYLLEIYKTRSFTEAAANLFVSQPAISEAIKKLEQELDADLIIRKPSTVDFTPLGLEIIHLAQSALNTINLIKETALLTKALDHLPPCDLTLLTVPVINESLVIHFLPQFHTLQPHVRLNIFEASFNAILDALKNSRCNLGIFHGNDQLVNQAVAAERDLIIGVISNALQCFVLTSAASPLAAKKSISLKELSELPFALSAVDAKDELVLDSLFRQNGTSPKIVFRSNKRDLIFEEVRSGRAVSTTHSVCLTHLADGLVPIPITGAQPLSLYYIYSSNDPSKKAIHYFLQAFIPFCQTLL